MLSFAFIFDREDDIYQFALTYPYSYSRLQSYLSVLEQKFPFQRDSLINSVQQRRLELITFDEVKKPEMVEPGKNSIRVVVVLARVHPSESPASYVVQGLIEFLAIANHPIAKLLRENVVFKILPMVIFHLLKFINLGWITLNFELSLSWIRSKKFLFKFSEAKH